MFYAKKIRMMPGCGTSSSLLEIDSIYLSGCETPGFYKKSVVHDHLKKYPGTIKVDLYPYPTLIPATSAYGEKYVRSSPDSSQTDDLLDLPRE